MPARSRVSSVTTNLANATDDILKYFREEGKDCHPLQFPLHLENWTMKQPFSLEQRAQANTAVQTVAAPPPEHTIRRLANRLNEARAKMDRGEKDNGR